MTRGHWQESPTAWRTTPRPLGWKAIAQAVKARDGHQCVIVENERRCPVTTGLEVDHIGDPEDHSSDNLRTLCGAHHRKKTATQARAVQLARQG